MAQRRGIYEEITGRITAKVFVNMRKSGEPHIKLSRFYIYYENQARYRNIPE